MRQEACKPGSVPGAVSSSKDRPPGGSHSSRPAVARRLEQPTRTSQDETSLPLPRRTRARGPYLALLRVGFSRPHRCRYAGALLPHHFNLAVALARAWAVYFLLHFPWARAPQALPGAVPCGARTFLHALADAAIAWPTPAHTIVRRWPRLKSHEFGAREPGSLAQPELTRSLAGSRTPDSRDMRRHDRRACVRPGCASERMSDLLSSRARPGRTR